MHAFMTLSAIFSIMIKSLSTIAMLTGAHGLLDPQELDSKVEAAKNRWSEIRHHTQEMLDKVHSDMENNLKKLAADREHQNALLKDNMKAIDAILKKDDELQKQIHPSFIQLFGEKSAEEIAASKKTEELLKQLRALVHTPVESALIQTEGKTEKPDTSSDPAIVALKQAQQRMQELQQKLHKQAMKLTSA